MIFETHSHYDDPAFDEDRDYLLSHMKEQGIGNIICAGAAWDSIALMTDICDRYSFCHLTLGIHPDNSGELTPEHRMELERLIEEKKPCAIGEIGLDYHYDDVPPEVQKEAFIYQLKLAEKYNLPVIIHSRDAHEETFEIIRDHLPLKRGVIHCFSSSPEMAQEYVKLGFLIGIGGVVTFKNGKKLKEVAQRIPLSSILLETDCPYLAPVPHRGERNSSLFLPLIAEEIANLRGISIQQVIDETEINAKKLFNIG